MATTTPVPAPPPPAQRSSAADGQVTTTLEPAVMGDGTTTRSRTRSRWLRLRWPLSVLLVLVLLAGLSTLLRPPTSTTPLAPDNPSDDGGRALAEVLTARGVEIDYVRTSGEAAAAGRDGTTLLVVGTYLLTGAQVDQLAGTDADLVLAEPEGIDLSRLSGEALTTAGGGGASDGDRAAQCTDPDALAAGTIRSTGTGLSATGTSATRPDVTLCFPVPGDPTVGAYAVVEDVGGRRVTVLDDQGLLRNDRLDQDGNAALVLRALGRHDRLTWYIPSYNDLGQEAAPSAGMLVPSWTRPLALQLMVLVAALALWRGRALGRIVTEPLPVTVRAAETTSGRGRLYRRSRSRGHAAAALRAGVARRTAARLGLPRTAGAPAVIDALARATGRSTEQVAGLLYGPPPTDDAGLLALARQLDEIESEVHRT